MKKHLFVFVTLFFTLTLLSGCGKKENTVRFDGNDKADVLSAEESGTTEENINTDENSEEDTTKEELSTEGESDEATTTSTEEDSNESVSPALSGKLSVTSFDGAYLKTSYSYNVVKGDAPAGTHMIKINDYRLSKYISGQTKWDYIASTRFGTLKSGLNTYTVKAYDKKGKVIDSLIFSINYNAPQTLPGVGASQWIALYMALATITTFGIFRKYRWL